MPTTQTKTTDLSQPTNITPEAAFKLFVDKYGLWVKRQAGVVSRSRGEDADDVEQKLLMKAWNAAQDPNFDPAKGKTLLGWMWQKVQFSTANLLRTKGHSEHEVVGVQDHEEMGASLDDLDGRACWDLLSPSRSLSSRHRRQEAVNLFQKVLRVVDKLPAKYRAIMQEMLEPSDAFTEHMDERMADGAYTTACFEMCGLSDLKEFTGASNFDIRVAIQLLRDKIPELREFVSR